MSPDLGRGTGYNLVYIVGPPAAGKSTLMREITRECLREPKPTPLPHDLLYPPSQRPNNPHIAVEIGRRREHFSGTDALGYSIAPAAAHWIATRPAWLVLGEGDRLATRGFLGAAEAAGYRITLIHLTADPETLDQRCAARGSAQNPAWRRGRATKAANLAGTAPQTWQVLSLSSSADPPSYLASLLRDLAPALQALPAPTNVLR